MRYGIFSDIHSNLEASQAVMDAYKKEDIDKYFCVGDIVGYAADPQECIQKIRIQADITVAGNHDWASVDLFSIDYFNPVAKQAILWTREKLDKGDKIFLESLKLVYKNKDLTLVHGTLDSPEDFNYMKSSYFVYKSFELLETNICFVGHSHIAGIFVKDKSGKLYYKEDNNIDIVEGYQYIINVGSVGQPRDGNFKAAYCIYDTETKKVQIKRINYNVNVTVKKIIQAGLPRFLAERLLTGQ